MILVVKPAGLLSRRGALLALQGVCVLDLTAQTVTIGHHFGRLDHTHVRLRLELHDPGIASAEGIGVLVLHQADGLGPSCDGDRYIIDHDAFGCSGNRHQTRRTLTVHAHPRRSHGQPRRDSALTREVVTLSALLIGCTHDHVLDLAGLESSPLHHGLNDSRNYARDFDVIE